jgi:hypothetical protein
MAAQAGRRGGEAGGDGDEGGAGADSDAHALPALSRHASALLVAAPLSPRALIATPASAVGGAGRCLLCRAQVFASYCPDFRSWFQVTSLPGRGEPARGSDRQATGR